MSSIKVAATTVLASFILAFSTGLLFVLLEIGQLYQLKEKIKTSSTLEELIPLISPLITNTPHISTARMLTVFLILFVFSSCYLAIEIFQGFMNEVKNVLGKLNAELGRRLVLLEERLNNEPKRQKDLKYALLFATQAQKATAVLLNMRLLFFLVMPPFLLTIALILWLGLVIVSKSLGLT